MDLQEREEKDGITSNDKTKPAAKSVRLGLLLRPKKLH
jgi:hypothetical protein